MEPIIRYPILVFAISLVSLWLSTRIGISFRKRRRKPEDEEFADFGLVLTAILTLLGLIIGFSFSMASARYDQRKTYEEAEANAIGTEYIRADLLPAANAASVRVLLKSYLDQRVLFYKTRNAQELQQLNATTAQLQADLWSATQSREAQPTFLVALAVSGMNDVLNSQGCTQAAWWNRLPTGAWGLMAVIAVCCNILLGYGARRAETESALLFVLPLMVSISFFLIADIDSPRGGLVRVQPRNLISLSESLRAH